MANFTSGFGWVVVGVLALIGLIVGWKSAGFLSFHRPQTFSVDLRILSTLLLNLFFTLSLIIADTLTPYILLSFSRWP
ncbi:MAG: hypothetical protein HZA06_02045 [Nitrospirae bacterium]|nr:hypothetical protein [Nitrospirota bacterium]